MSYKIIVEIKKGKNMQEVTQNYSDVYNLIDINLEGLSVFRWIK